MPSVQVATYDDALHFLLEFTDYEKVTKYKYDIATFDLGRVEDLMGAVGSPHRAFRSVHIAGTKGKGSTGTMVQSILTAAGLRTGLYTSPHLCRLEERMTVDGKMMPEAELIEILNEIVPYTRTVRSERPNESPTFFELVTTIAFRHFVRRQVDFGVIEVGLGGRLDATNVILPEVSVITRVDYDHVERLGDTLAKIAAEKAGIIKPGVPVICAAQEAEALATIRTIAEEREAPLTLIGRDYALEAVETGAGPNGPLTRFNLAGPFRRYAGITLGLLGTHQAQNAATAVAVAEYLSEKCGAAVSEDAVRRGLHAARLPARSELFPGKPPILLDGAHNPVSVQALGDTLDAVFLHRHIVMILGFSRDKDTQRMLRQLLPRAAHVLFTQSDSPRAELPEILRETACDLCDVPVETCKSPTVALARARKIARPEDVICIAGSFYLAGNLRPALLGRLIP